MVGALISPREMHGQPGANPKLCYQVILKLWYLVVPEPCSRRLLLLDIGGFLSFLAGHTRTVATARTTLTGAALSNLLLQQKRDCRDLFSEEEEQRPREE